MFGKFFEFAHFLRGFEDVLRQVRFPCNKSKVKLDQNKVTTLQMKLFIGTTEKCIKLKYFWYE